jgi:hypothetical protein
MSEVEEDEGEDGTASKCWIPPRWDCKYSIPPKAGAMVRLDQEWCHMAMIITNVQIVGFRRKNQKSVLAVCAIRLNGQTDRVIQTVRITIRTRTVAIPQ